MKRYLRSLWSLAMFLGVFIAALLCYLQLERSSRAGLQAELEVQESQSLLREWHLALRSLQSERANFRLVLRQWEDARSAYETSLRRLDGHFDSRSGEPAGLVRLDGSWHQMDEYCAAIRGSLDILERGNLIHRIESSSLTGKYQELLGRAGGSDLEVAELSLLLLHIESADRLTREMDGEYARFAMEWRLLVGERQRQQQWLGVLVLVSGALSLGWFFLIFLHQRASLAAEARTRSEAETKVAASETALSAALRAFEDTVLILDSEGRILKANAGASKLLQVRDGELGTRTLSQLCRILDPDTRADRSSPAPAAPGELSRDRLLLVQRDGGERLVAASSATMEGGLGQVLVLQDVTERERLEELSRRTQKLDALGQLAGGVAHDFNNHLLVIRANLEFLRLGRPSTPEDQDYLTQAEEATLRAVELARQLLALGRRQTLQFRSLRLDLVLQDFMKLVRGVVGQAVILEYSCQEPLDLVQGDERQLEQVLLNLCVNACDAMPEGGSLSIEAGNQLLGEVALRDWPGLRPGRYVRIRISDTGRGMDAPTLARVFEPFFSTKPMGRGAGLGLSVVQGIVQQHGGFITVTSLPGRGSCFTVNLPSHPSPESLQAKPLADGAGSPKEAGTGHLILVVEDELPVRMVINAILRRQGYRVLLACDGEEACRIAEPRLDEISAAVLDVVMPRMGGIEAARRLQQLKPSLPIILSTGYAGGVEVEELNRSDGWRLLTKPYASEELSQMLAKVLAAGSNAGV